MESIQLIFHLTEKKANESSTVPVIQYTKDKVASIKKHSSYEIREYQTNGILTTVMHDLITHIQE